MTPNEQLRSDLIAMIDERLGINITGTPTKECIIGKRYRVVQDCLYTEHIGECVGPVPGHGNYYKLKGVGGIYTPSQVELVEDEKLPVNAWYGWEDCNGGIYFPTDERGGGYGLFRYGNTWSKENDWVPLNSRKGFYYPATPAEVTAALTAYAEKQGYKEGVKITSLLIKGCTTGFDKEGDTRMSSDGFWYMGSVVMQDGVWATIVKEQPIYIDKYEVKHFGSYGDTTIDGHEFTKSFWQSAKVVAEHSKAKIKIGCSHQFDLSLDTINRILERGRKG